MQVKFILGLLILVVTPQLSSAAACLVANCNICSPNKSNICALCKTNYMLNNGQCDPNSGFSCNVNYCIKCRTDNLNYCELCQTYYKTATDLSGRCLPESCASSNCFLCTSDRNYCDRCNLGYWSNFFGDCIKKCDYTYCLVCAVDISTNENRCIKCKSDYVLNCKLYIKI